MRTGAGGRAWRGAGSDETVAKQPRGQRQRDGGDGQHGQEVDGHIAYAGAFQVDAALSKLYTASPQAKDLVQRARGVLVFPSVMGASFIVGGEHGKG
ncbi:hypothetical protein AZ14_2468, partial [Bordetella bronchiseptica 980]